MEKINRHNYEAYFLDYLEGNLGAEEKNDLYLFLEKNPDLKAALEIDFSDVVLLPENSVFASKQSLKVDEESLLSLNTVEAWMIESVEGNLTVSKQQELDEFIRKHQLQKTYTAYQATVLKPDLTEVFSDKRKLKVETGRVIPMYTRIAAAAAVAILLIGVSQMDFSNSPAQPVAEDQIGVQDFYNGTVMNLAQKNRVESSTDEAYNSPNNQPDNRNERPVQFDLQNDPNKQLVENETKDTSKALNPSTPEDEKFANQESKDPFNVDVKYKDENDVVIAPFNAEAKPSYVTEEPYKMVTDAATNFTNREIEFTREKNVATNEYVAYGFRIGNFEFERKKSE